MAYRTIGNTVIEWDDDKPFIFTITEITRSDDDRKSINIKIDLSELRSGFEDTFLLHLKDHLIERRNQVTIVSIKTESSNLLSLFCKITELKVYESKIGIVDEALLLCLSAIKDKFSGSSLKFLKMAFTSNPYSSLFAHELQASDFPLQRNKKGGFGSQIDRILAKALSQSAVAHILDRCDAAYDSHKIDIGHYSFVHLAFAIFCRPESYRQIRLADLIFDVETNKYFISIIPVKTGVLRPNKIRYQINEPLGILLIKQRQNVIDTYGHLVAPQHIEKLALFPARRLRADGTRWISNFANKNFGMYEHSSNFIACYPERIKTSIGDEHFTMSANSLRHTVGTLLAQSGASAQSIQAVLKHSNSDSCQAYVDIAFHGLMKELSDTMRPSFQCHFPAFARFNSKNSPVPIAKAIRSEDLETGQIEQIGECGKDIACTHAPISCYGCFRFIPNWDADHSINVNILEREIDDFKQKGKPFESMVERARTAKNHIMLVMHAADRYRDNMQQENRR